MARTKFLPHQIKAWYEGCRQRPIELWNQGWHASRIAEALGVSYGAVSQWLRKYREGGQAALQSKKSTGREPKLSPSQQQELLELLQRSAEEFGFRSEVWSGPRVKRLIKKLWGIEYHEKYIPDFLKKLGWSPQRPEKQAQQQDQEAIKHWQKQTWPQLKKKPKKKSER